MKTYSGLRTELGCEVTVDGEPLAHRSDLSGSASSVFDWGFVGTGQLSVALLADFLGDDLKAKAICGEFERKIVAELPHRGWTMTGKDMTRALAGLAGVHAASGDPGRPLKDNEPSGVDAHDAAGRVVTEAASEMANAANCVAAAAMAVSKAATEVSHVGDRPADEAMSTANRAADAKAHATNRAVDEAAALAESAVKQANRVVAKLIPNRV